MTPKKRSPLPCDSRLGPGLNCQLRLPYLHDRRVNGNSCTVAHVKVPNTNYNWPECPPSNDTEIHTAQATQKETYLNLGRQHTVALVEASGNTLLPPLPISPHPVPSISKDIFKTLVHSTAHTLNTGLGGTDLELTRKPSAG